MGEKAKEEMSKEEWMDLARTVGLEGERLESGWERVLDYRKNGIRKRIESKIFRSKGENLSQED